MDYSFGSWVRRRRKALDLTQHELARRVGCSVSLIFKIESDERRPSRQIAELLAEHLEIPAGERERFLKVARQEKAVGLLERVPPPIALPGAEAPPDPDSGQRELNLPLPLTSLLGRERELEAIIAQIHDPVCRLLTLTGPGGVGKTRLALEVAHRLRTGFEYGACFVPLVGTSACEFIIPAIADALGFSFSGTLELKAQLFHFLKEKEILLVLDNLEHLLDGIEFLDELLELAPGVKLLTTSREQLNLRAEWVFEVQGLPVPSSLELGHPESSSAAALFLQRARQVNANFVPAPEDLPAIVRICRFVEGLPLGLELAATWVRLMPVQEIAREMEQNLDFLSTTARDMAPRHRSMRAVFDQSWSLLSSEERQAMQRLSVFRGGFTREAAEQVAGAELPVLSALVDKSLVRRGQAGRYDLHELIRQYAATRLDVQERGATDRKHANYYLGLLQARESALRSHLQKETLAELRPEIDNLRAAWERAVADHEIELLRRSSGPVYYFYELHQYFQEAETLYQRGAEMVRARMGRLEAAERAAERARLDGALGDMLTHRAFFLQRMGRNREALELHRQSIGLLRPLNEPNALTFALVLYGVLCWAVGDLKEALLYLHEGLPLSRTLKHPWLQSIALCFLGATAHDQGRYDEAHRWFSEAMELCRQTKDPYVTLLIGTLFSRTAQLQGRLVESQTLLHENLQIARESGNRWGIGLGLEQMAAMEQTMGNHAEARRMLEESVAIYREIGDAWSLSRALNTLSQLALEQLEFIEAERAAARAVKTATEVEYNLNALNALATLAETQARQGRNLPALEMALFVLAHPASSQSARDRAERLRTDIEPQLGLEQAGAARSRMGSQSLSRFAEAILAA